MTIDLSWLVDGFGSAYRTHPIFIPIKTYPSMTVKERAANAASSAGSEANRECA